MLSGSSCSVSQADQYGDYTLTMDSVGGLESILPIRFSAPVSSQICLEGLSNTLDQ